MGICSPYGGMAQTETWFTIQAGSSFCLVTYGRSVWFVFLLCVQSMKENQVCSFLLNAFKNNPFVLGFFFAGTL